MIMSDKQLRIFEKQIFYSPDGCWYWTGSIQTKGYGCFMNKTTHRLSYHTFKKQDPVGLNVCHSCDNRLCVNPDHLWLGTHADNILDKVKKGRQSRGPKNRNTPQKSLNGWMELIEHMGYTNEYYRKFSIWRYRCMNCGHEEITYIKVMRHRIKKCKNCKISHYPSRSPLPAVELTTPQFFKT